MAPARMTASRFESLKVSGMVWLLLHGVKGAVKRAASIDTESIRWRPGRLRERFAEVPWLCVAVFRRVCSEQRLMTV